MMRRQLAFAALVACSCNSPVTFDDGKRPESGGSAGFHGLDAAMAGAGAGGAPQREAGSSPGPAGAPASTGGRATTDDTRPAGQAGRTTDNVDAASFGGRATADAGPVPCRAMTDCPPGNTCDAAGHCIETCLNGVACPTATPHCDARGVCVRCTQNADCAASTAGHVCNPANGECVECVSSTECTHLLPRCDTATNTCVRCSSNADCASQHEWPICSSSGACIDN